MKDRIIAEIQAFVQRHQNKGGTTTHWETPLVGFAAAEDPLFPVLKRVVAPEHLLPRDLLPAAETVIALCRPLRQQRIVRRPLRSVEVLRHVPAKRENIPRARNCGYMRQMPGGFALFLHRSCEEAGNYRLTRALPLQMLQICSSSAGCP
jgi:hypothetical protein